MGIQAGGLAAVFANLDSRIFVGIRIFGTSQHSLVLVGTVQADKFSAHGVGKDAGTAIVVAGGGAFALSEVVFSSMSRRERRGQEPVTIWRFVGEARSAIGHAVAFLAGEARKGLVGGGGIVVPVVSIEDLAPVTTLGVLLLGKTFRTASFSFGTWFPNDLTDGIPLVVFFVIQSARDKGLFLFEFGSMLQAKLIAEFGKRRRL